MVSLAASPAPDEDLSGRRAALDEAIVQTVTYSDVFAYPLTAAEVHRYLVGMYASQSEVWAALATGALVPQRLVQVGDYYALPGREAVVEQRMRRAETAARLWPKAMRWGRVIAGLPFVRMVAVTGALSVDNSDAGDDLDYLIVTEPGRLWLCRAMVVALVRLAAREGDIVCPNYFLSERALAVKERNLYTAREMAQMVPIAGMAVYRRMRQANAWVDEYLPNAVDPPRPMPPEPRVMPLVKAVAESVLRTPPGAWLESWEMRRKLTKLSRQGAESPNPAESQFGPDWCKGHFHAHRQHTIDAMGVRLRGR